MELTVYLCPDPWQVPGISIKGRSSPISVSRDEDLGHQEVTLKLLPEGAEDGCNVEMNLCPLGAEELQCLMCKQQDDESIGATAEKLMAMINDERSSGCSTCSPLEWDYRIRRVATAHVSALASDTMLDPRFYFQHHGVSFLHAWTVDGFITKETGLKVTDEDLEILLAGWIANASDRGQLMNPNFTRAALAFQWSGSDPRGWWAAVSMADQDKQDANAGDFDGTTPSMSCSYSCFDELEYYRRQTAETFGQQAVYSDLITFRFHTPEVCNLWHVILEGDVRGPRAAWICPTQGQAPCSGDVPLLKTDAPILGGRTYEFEMASIPPYPGEFFAVWGYLHGTQGTCNPILIACCYFSHFCLTSGKISSICLVENDQVLEERTSGSTPQEWIGDERLKYKASCEGKTLTVAPSDFASYTVDNRVVIQKGGIHTIKTLGGDQAEAGCQDPYGGTEFDTLRWDLTRPVQDQDDGIIIPQKLWGI